MGCLELPTHCERTWLILSISLHRIPQTQDKAKTEMELEINPFLTAFL